MGGKDLVLYRNAQSGDFLLPCCLCPWGREISPLRLAAVKMTGRSHLYFRHRYSLLQASFLFLHSSPPGGDFLMEWGMAAEVSGWNFEACLLWGSCILLVTIETFPTFLFLPSQDQTNFFHCKQVGVCGRMWVNVEEVEEICS